MFKVYGSSIKLVQKNVAIAFKRYKNPPDHWSVIRKKVTLSDKALQHLDEFYGSTYGDRWTDIRTAILRPNKHVAVVNNFGDDLETMEHLEQIGSLNLKDIYNENKEKLKYKLSGDVNIVKNNNSDIDSKISEIAKQLSEEEISELYGSNREITLPKILDTGSAIIQQSEEETIQNNQEIIQNANVSEDGLSNYELGRIIDPDMGMSTIALHNYVPATKLKGMEDWLPESHQFQYYLDAKDFPVTVEECDDFEIPPYLNIYIFNLKDKKKFFDPKVGKAEVYNYYLMDGASIFPAIALNCQPGDRVLDMCASPGGKTLLFLLTMMPSMVIANDVQLSRTNRIHKVMREYLYDYGITDTWSDRIMVTQSNGKNMKDDLGFDKILVDVPCTADRHSVRNDDENIFQPRRLKERLKLPELQSDLLCNALKLCKINGTVIYSTCTLSPLENDGVVKLGLKKAFEKHNITATIKLYTRSILPLRGLFQFGEGSLAAKYGHVIVPHVFSNYGPAYFAKIVRNE